MDLFASKVTTSCPDLKHRRSQRTDTVFLLLIAAYVVLATLQINQPPLERYPNWDVFWTDCRSAGKLLNLKHALRCLELPSITPYTGLGSNVAGDPLPISFLSPPDLLVLFLPPHVVILVRAMFFQVLSGIGAYLFLAFLTQDRCLSFLGGLTYISLPIVLGSGRYAGTLVFWPVPLLLLLIHKVVEQQNTKKSFLFVALSVFAISSGNIHTLVILPSIVATYSFLVTYGYYRLSVAKAVKTALGLVLLCVLAGSFYVVPLCQNLHTIASSMNGLREAGLCSDGGAASVRDFLKFFYQYGLQTLYLPLEGSGFLLYVPAFQYFAIALSLALRRFVFQPHPRQEALPIFFVALGFLMVVISVAFYALPGLSRQGHGVLRGHINLAPFMHVLAGFLCFAAMSQLKGIGKLIYVPLLFGPFVVDWLLFVRGLPLPPHALPGLFGLRHTVGQTLTHSSNLVSVRFWRDMWPALPWLNLAFVLLLFLHSFTKEIRGARAKRLCEVAFAGAALALSLVIISVYNELRATQQNEWQAAGRSSYSWDSYRERKACMDNLVNRRDPNYRTLPASRDVFECGRGRNWKLIGETELNVEDREKVLFAYRETMDPFAALLYSTFDHKFVPSNWFPPLSASVAGNMEILRLMGVKWVISADERIVSPDLIYRGKCITEKTPPRLLQPSTDGAVHIYEVRNPLRVVFLADHYQVVNLSISLKTVFEKKVSPWSRGIVYLEAQPTAGSTGGEGPKGEIIPGLQAEAKIVRETLSSVEVNVTAPSTKWLVLSYLYHRDWRAWLGPNRLRIYRAYGGLMTVQVPPGRHVLTFKYRPLDVYVGLLLTGLAFALAVVSARWCGSRSRGAYVSRP